MVASERSRDRTRGEGSLLKDAHRVPTRSLAVELFEVRRLSLAEDLEVTN